MGCSDFNSRMRERRSIYVAAAVKETQGRFSKAHFPFFEKSKLPVYVCLIRFPRMCAAIEKVALRQLSFVSKSNIHDEKSNYHALSRLIKLHHA